MTEASNASYPSSLDVLFDGTSPLREQYDPVKLADAEIVPILQLPLAGELLGHNSADASAISRVSNGEICYTTFLTEKAKATAQMPFDGLTSEQQRSQILHIGLAALFSFMQSNITGPPLDFNSADVVFPKALHSDATKLRAVRNHIIRELSVDGEAAYKLTPNVELFAVAKALLVDADILVPDGPLVARTTRVRVNFLHQKMLSEATSTLQDAIYSDLDELSKMLLSEKSVFSTAQEKGRFLVERATIHTHHGFDAKARSDLEQAAAVRKFEFALTGRLGKRTKFQEHDISQLVVLAKRYPQAGPKNLDLNDDTLLESISFTKDARTSKDKSTTVQEESTLPPALHSLDPGNQPMLDPVDSAILLGLASAITNTSPENGLTREETHPYAIRVLEGGSSNWQVYTQALLVRSRVEGYRARTVERSVLQMQALVDQVIADTATLDTQATENGDQATTFLPRPEKSESASAAERLEYIWLLNSPTRWSLEAELAQRWVNLGGLRTALDIYERLQMWAEAALCYAATDREEKAKHIVRRQLYEPTGPDPDDENEKFDGPELSPLPVDAPRLLCILGDIDSDPTMYERAWEVSNNRYARAQRSLARHYLSLKPPALEKAEEAYRKSLHINRLNHSAWFALGCVQLELQKWEDAIDSFTRTVQLEVTDAEAWSNLAAAILRTAKPSETTETAEEEQQDADADADSETKKAPQDPYKRKREALAALHRAAQLKHTDARIWDNVLTVAASIPPPATPFRDVVTAQRRVIEVLGPKNGENMLIEHVVDTYNYEDLLIKVDENDENSEPVVRSGTIAGQVLSLVDECVVPLITHSAPLWLLVARPSKAFEAHEKAWRATVASCTQGAFQMGDAKKWMDVVRATERLFGPMDKEGKHEGEAEMVAKDWRFKARSADFWEELHSEVGSS
ncbi:tetratricopeptide repeat protein [Aspergillus novofumigatus IBT 16806]|uniref:Tetratricopeptide repeat domain protein n=1 Tax=Aspergillus novofumigatus (strain IBT 16806) TaxID=1392255 RepID=A0A2I1BZ52_ASPN1|nr:tetratricopeptide repeat domain protein [Aspergillus novofumigatus IBT 16806]PKX90660.1 tetratricopeptide repeat domain protein [Aspergillus novofumigatus IBT 16806]